MLVIVYKNRVYVVSIFYFTYSRKYISKIYRTIIN